MTDLERRLEAMLQVRAQDITAMPPRVLDAEPQRGRPRWMLAVAAAVVVLLVAGIVLALRSGDTDNTAPAGNCTTELPSAWREAFRPVDQPFPRSDQALAVTRSGVLVTLVTGAFGKQVRTLEPGSGRVLLEVGTADGEVTAAAIGRNSVVVALSTVAQGAIGSTAPPSHSTPQLSGSTRTTSTRAIYVFDAQTGARTVVARSDATHDIGGVAVLGDTVYYDVHPNASTDAGSVEGYLVPEDAHDVEYSGNVGMVRGTAFRVDWNNGSVGGDVPDNVQQILTDDAVTDGTAYAAVSNGGIAWADRDGTVRGPFEQQVVATPVVVGVAGPGVFFHDYDSSDELYVLDSRTGAVADLGIPQTGPMPSGGGFIALSEPARRIDTNGLPELHC